MHSAPFREPKFVGRREILDVIQAEIHLILLRKSIDVVVQTDFKIFFHQRFSPVPENNIPYR
ncbi:hypothetical protein SDC9_212350 [bioreactor metagenome]|uniref:Uncharacterized protein n=1 Tax=bioreactor metagenome TaxID=1076179 RepID=A0A645JYL4_9ZZZZ